VNTLIPHTRTNVQNLVQFIGIVREKYQNKLTVFQPILDLTFALAGHPWKMLKLAFQGITS
jgi:hypothetical protein